MSIFEVPANVQNPLKLTTEERERTRRDIVVGSLPSGTFFLMNFLAAVIAGYGLLQDSPAVVIGAMLVAMMLGPIVGLGLAASERDRALLLTSLTSIVMGTALVIGVGIAIGAIHSQHALTDEIIGRTAPNVMDLAVAIAGGLAGAIATVSTRLPVAVVGVGVATALVPPLVTCGILLSRGEFELASGAFLLTLTNMVAIEFASALVLWFAGLRIRDKSVSFFSANLWSIILISVLAVFLTFNLKETTTQQRLDLTVKETLRNQFDVGSNRLITAVIQPPTEAANDDDGKITITAYIQGDTPPTADDVRKAEQALPQLLNLPPFRLDVRFVPVQIISSELAG